MTAAAAAVQVLMERKKKLEEAKLFFVHEWQ